MAAEPRPEQVAKHIIDFRRDVFPILSRRCWECHLGGDASSRIRLDVREEWLGETTERPFVVVGKSGRSRVIEVVEGRDAKIVMPAEGERLKPAEIATLRKWIDDGLAWDDELLPTPKVKSDHWAIQPRRLGTHARVSNGEKTGTGRSTQPTLNPIDVFIAEKQRELGVQSASETDRRTLMRRLSLDLLGLPPSSDDVEDLVVDERPDAVVDHSALVRALGFQVFFVLLARLMLDGGTLLRCYTAVAIGDWVAAVGILVACPGK